MDLGSKGETVCVGKSARTFIRADGKASKMADSADLSFQEKLLRRFYSIRTAIRHR